MPQTQRKLPPTDVVMVFPYKAWCSLQESCDQLIINPFGFGSKFKT